MARFAPALLLALSGAWCGTFAGGATAAGSAAAVALLLGMLLWTGAPWQDPLRLGGTLASLLPLALWAAMAVSQWASPVPRAGRLAVVLLPAFLWLPGAVERCWLLAKDRQEGVRAVSAAAGGIALWALVHAVLAGGGRAAMPLGHHNLLAAFLVILLPLAALPACEPGPWRWLGWASGGAAVLAVVASRSLLGSAALLLEGIAALVLWCAGGGKAWRRAGAVVLLAVALAVAAQIPRAVRILQGEDSSASARVVYYQAGWDGFRARPLLGWGPGSASWTAAAFLRPRPGVNPWGEVVGELHSLPLQLAYETGAAGLALALSLGGLFFWKRIVGLRQASDPPLLAAGLLGLAGGTVTALGSGALAVTALPLAAAIATGAALAALPLRAEREMSLPVRVYAVAAGLALFPLILAQWHYDRAVNTPESRTAAAREELAAALQLDPEHPLYRTRLALLQGSSPGGRAAAAALAHQGAREGGGVAALWLIAGVLGEAANQSWTVAALEKACALDPLNGLPPFYLAVADPQAAGAARHGAHALLAEPRLAAAVFWEGRGPLFHHALDEVRRWPGVDAGWKESLIAAAGEPAPDPGASASLRLEVDSVSALSLSLHAFRRRPWPAGWPLVEVRLEPAQRLSLPAAAVLPTTTAAAFSPEICGAGGGDPPGSPQAVSRGPALGTGSGAVRPSDLRSSCGKLCGKKAPR